MIIYQVLFILSVEILGSLSYDCFDFPHPLLISGLNLQLCNRDSYLTNLTIEFHYSEQGYKWDSYYTRCCRPPTVWRAIEKMVEYVGPLERRNKYVCPNGYFLNGFHRNRDMIESKRNPNKIISARSVKAAAHPVYYEDCYVESGPDGLTNLTYSTRVCSKKEYYVTGLEVLNSNTYYHFKITCCKMASKPHEIHSFEQLKEHIMTTKLMAMAKLADILGFKYCSGIKSNFHCGEDFERSKDTWQASNSTMIENEECNGDQCLNRLKIDFGNWDLVVKNITYGEGTADMFEGETIDSGTIYNCAKAQVTESFVVSKTVEDTVITTLSDNFISNDEMSLSMSLNIPLLFDLSQSYKTTVDVSLSNLTSTKTTKSRTYRKTTAITLDPSTAASYDVIVRKSRITIPYTVAVVATFSTEFSGILKEGTDSFNYHNLYYGTYSNKYISYRFGDENNPFYKALKNERDSKSWPWLWSEMENDISHAINTINSLTDEQSYEVELSGTLEKVSGTKIDVVWKTEQLTCPYVID